MVNLVPFSNSANFVGIQPHNCKGYIASGKSVATTLNGGVYISYVLSLESTSNGNQLCVIPYIGNDSTNLSALPTLKLEKLYRLPIVGNLRNVIGNNDSIYNPGGTNNLNITNEYFHEVNVFRKDIANSIDFNNYKLSNAYNNGSVYSMIINNGKIEVSDIQGSIVVKNDGPIDHVFISCVCRVDIFGSLNLYKDSNPKFSILSDPKYHGFYSIPMIFKYTFARSTVGSLSNTGPIVPNAFSYQLGISDTEKINLNIVTTKENQFWNYNIIPLTSLNLGYNPSMTYAQNTELGKLTFFKFLANPCIADIDYDPTTNAIYSTSSIGDINIINKPVHNLYVAQFKDLVNVTQGLIFGLSINTIKYQVAPNITIPFIKIIHYSTYLLIMYSTDANVTLSPNQNTYNNISCNTELLVYNLATPIPVHIATQIFSYAIFPSITVWKNFVYFGYYSSRDISKYYIIKILDITKLNDFFNWYNIIGSPSALIDSSYNVNASVSERYQIQCSFPFSPLRYLGGLNYDKTFYKSWGVQCKAELENLVSVAYTFNQDIDLVAYDDSMLMVSMIQGPLVPISNCKMSSIALTSLNNQRLTIEQVSSLTTQNIKYSKSNDIVTSMSINFQDKIINSVNIYSPKIIDLSVADLSPTWWFNSLFVPVTGNDPAPGIDVRFQLSNCEGLYSDVVIAPSSWDDSLTPSYINSNNGANGAGGIKLNDNYLRRDLNVIYSGSKSNYDFATKSGYWTHLTNDGKANLEITYNNGKNLLISDYSRYVDPHISEYSNDGKFNLFFIARLNLVGVTDSNGNTFDKSGFSLTNVNIKLGLLNNIGQEIASTGVKTIDLTPPQPDGSITVSPDKTNITIPFAVTRASNGNSFTTLRNVKINHFHQLTNKTDNQGSKNYTDRDVVAGTENIIINADMLSRGDYITIQYEAWLHDKKQSDPPIQITKKVSCVKNHKFRVTNSSIFIKDTTTGTYGSNLNSLIKAGNPYVYIDSFGNNSVDLKVTYSCIHESWNDRTELADHLVYPTINRVYLYAGENHLLPSYMYDAPPAGMPIAYPNVSNSSARELKSYFDSNPYLFISVYDSIPSNTTIITNRNLELTLNRTGNWVLWLMVEDQFNQLSLSCLTNIYNWTAKFQDIGN